MNIRFKLFAKKQVYVPTVLGWCLLLVCATSLSVFCFANAYSFLAYENPKDADVFIIEGWVPDHVLEESIPEFQASECRLILTTGGPLRTGGHLSQYNSYAELTAARLVKLGFRDEQIVPVPNQEVNKGRTYAAAMAIRKWLSNNPGITRAILVTKGPHARRSYLVFRSVLPSTFELGVYAAPPRDYDPKRWWTSSEGFRTVVSEAIAYAYARFVSTH